MQTKTGPSRVFRGRRGKPFVVCSNVSVPREGKFEIVEVSNENHTSFQQVWKVIAPFCVFVFV
jgi:hypothetical protein